MPENYVQTKIKEAMTASGGDRHDAQKLLVAWAVRDQPLLLGLTKPHLKAIAAAQIENALHAAKKSGSPDKKAIDLVVSQNIGDKRGHIVPPPKSSERQASVMHQLAAAFRKRKE